MFSVGVGLTDTVSDLHKQNLNVQLRCGECSVKINSLLFADDVVLLVSSDFDIQCLLGQLTAVCECEAAG